MVQVCVLHTCFAIEIHAMEQAKFLSIELLVRFVIVPTVGNDETVSANALKEIHEEMGISGIELRHHFDYLHKSAGLQYWGSMFSCTWDGPLQLQPQEVESGLFMSMQVRYSCICVRVQRQCCF